MRQFRSKLACYYCIHIGSQREEETERVSVFKITMECLKSVNIRLYIRV